MGLSKDLLPVLAVALLTWGGVFFYLLRLEHLALHLEQHVNNIDDDEIEHKDVENADGI